jgi:hypothetical protein
MSRFAAMPPAPRFGVPDWEVRMLDAMRQNVELLVNQRRESDQASVAVLESTYNFSSTLRPTLLTQYTPQALYQFQIATLAVFGGGTANAIYYSSGSGGVPDQFNTTLRNSTVSKDVLDDIGADVKALRATVNEIVTRLRS